MDARRYQEKGDGELVKMSSGHWVMRHYPGEGSHAHGIVVHTDAKRYVRGVRVLGRSGRIDLDTRPFENSDQVELRSIVWSHLAHKSELEHSIDDAVQLCQSRPKQGRSRGKLIWMGDFNIDPVRDRDQEWLRLQEALNGTGLIRSEPRYMEASPHLHCTRRPNGDQGGDHVTM